ncbi:glycosyltransferase [Hyphomicrobium sp. xq]|uniref:Glycosyltransferase n=1 Tax=Hyphomicrobium album TaxID=2665159 RepID=A0A6I3KLM4_9HYPH|nr:glycosyltransferase family 2 protein [Hyphomicrobium album]MTD94662.1 glycosyltransferase [Hyphomicrobium album]
MKISIITVTRNSERTVADAVDSVNRQTYQNIDHVVIDGASSDATVDIVKRVGHRLSYLSSEPDTGIYDAMNKGLMHADGEIVAFLNSDDFYSSPDVVAVAVERMRQKSLDALFGDVEFVSPKNLSRVTRRYRSDKFTPNQLRFGIMPAHPALFMRRSIYTALNGFKTTYRIAGDFEFIVRAFAEDALKYEYLGRVLVRMRTGGISTGGLRSRLTTNSEILRALKENAIDASYLTLMLRYPAKAAELLARFA